MTIDIPTMLSTCIQIVLFIVLLILSVRLIQKSRRSLTAVFLTFVYALWLLTDLYWVIYDFMRPDSRMPFAVNEIGEAAIILLMPSILSSAVNYRTVSARKQAIAAVLFAVCNAALWIAWSGEWAQDIIIGASFAYFLCRIACALKIQRQLSKNEWIGLGIACTLLIFAQVITFFVETQTRASVETGCYIFLITGAVYWAYKLFAAGRTQASPKAMLCLVFALLSWSMIAKYMSGGMWYTAFMATETIALLLLYLSVRKMVVDV